MATVMPRASQLLVPMKPNPTQAMAKRPRRKAPMSRARLEKEEEGMACVFKGSNSVWGVGLALWAGNEPLTPALSPEGRGSESTVRCWAGSWQLSPEWRGS
ncbi:hypothetical protein D9M69_606150 [compost metagenome]